jgi:uncharacterized C2H2 Zn-finger protein
MKIFFAKLIPPLTDDEYSKLEQSILKEGCRDALIVWMKDNDTILIDGHNRYEICTRHQITYKTQEIHFDSEQEAEIWILINQLSRRNLTDDQRAIITDEVIERQSAINKITRTEQARETKQKKKSVSDAPSDTETIWRCPGCGETFDEQVVHCRHCDHHWLIGEKSCRNCYKSLRGSPRAVKTTHDAFSPKKKDARKDISKKAKVSERKVKKARKLRKEKPVLAEKVRSGDLTLLEADREIKKEKKEADEKERTIAAEKLSKTMPSGGIVVHGDFRHIGESVADNSCTLIFTDPPYDRESLPLFESLGEFANRVLVDGGSLITFCGQYVMDEVMQSLGKNLRYFWVCCCLHTGDTAAMREYGIKVKWKPMLWYVKGKFRYDREVWVDDLVKSQQEKDYHPWQQSVIEAKHFIETLTRSGDLVCDPFCGGGTTAFAAKELGRKFWTCDVDARHIQTAKERLA